MPFLKLIGFILAAILVVAILCTFDLWRLFGAAVLIGVFVRWVVISITQRRLVLPSILCILILLFLLLLPYLNVSRHSEPYKIRQPVEWRAAVRVGEADSRWTYTVEIEQRATLKKEGAAEANARLGGISAPASNPLGATSEASSRTTTSQPASNSSDPYPFLTEGMMKAGWTYEGTQELQPSYYRTERKNLPLSKWTGSTVESCESGPNLIESRVKLILAGNITIEGPKNWIVATDPEGKKTFSAARNIDKFEAKTDSPTIGTDAPTVYVRLAHPFLRNELGLWLLNFSLGASVLSVASFAAGILLTAIRTRVTEWIDALLRRLKLINAPTKNTGAGSSLPAPPPPSTFIS